MAKFCKRFQAILTTTDTPIPALVRARCKQWDCYYCADLNRREWRYTIFKYIEANPDIKWSFHTFTMPRNIHNSKNIEAAVMLIKTYWERLIKRLTRRYGKFPYIRVIELHASGVPHIHLMAGFSIPENDLKNADNPKKSYILWLKKQLNRKDLPFGYMVNNQNARGNAQQATVYITKYMTKADNRLFELAKMNKLRIVSTSRIKKTSDSSEYEWKIRAGLNEKDFDFYPVWHDINLRREITLDDMNGQLYPPVEILDEDSDDTL